MRCGMPRQCRRMYPRREHRACSAQVFPDIFHRVQFRCIGRQGEQGDVVWHLKVAASLVPAGAIQDHDGMRSLGHLGVDFLEMFVHGLDIDRRHDKGGTDAAGRADGTEQVCRVEPAVAHHEGAGANRCPDIGMRALLADPGFILGSYLQRPAGWRRATEQRRLHQAGEVFSKTVWAASSFFGWNGRACSRVRLSLRSHLPIVRSLTVTLNRRATSARRSIQRQLTTSCVSGRRLWRKPGAAVARS
jgi:hypothetical protein